MMKSRNGLIALTCYAAALAAAGAPAWAAEGDWILRFRAIGVIPTAAGSGISPDLLTSGLDPQAMAVPEVDLTYMVTNNFGIELIDATSPHDLEGTGGIANIGDAAELWLLPPTLLLQYHFQQDQRFRPYVGAGINYTISYGENAFASLENTHGPTGVNADNSLGFAIQAGFDYDIDERWFFNADVKYIDMSLDVDLTSPGITRQIEVDLHPVIVGVGFGFRF